MTGTSPPRRCPQLQALPQAVRLAFDPAAHAGNQQTAVSPSSPMSPRNHGNACLGYDFDLVAGRPEAATGWSAALRLKPAKPVNLPVHGDPLL
jgi:hypothetical protein